MRNAAILLVVCSLSAFSAAESLPSFNYVGAPQLKQAVDAAPRTPIQARATDVISRQNLLVQAGSKVLFGYADTEAQYKEALAYWTPVLAAAGVRVGETKFENGSYTIAYTAPGGRVIREFLAEARQFPPKDEAGLRANMALAQSALAKAGLTPISARVVNMEVLLPTYHLLYLASAAETAEHETLLRVLKPGDDLDLDIIKASGVQIVQTPETWMLVYIGPELGMVSMAAHDQAELDQKIQKRKDFLLQEGKRMIGQRVDPLDDPEYKLAVQLYFFQ